MGVDFADYDHSGRFSLRKKQEKEGDRWRQLSGISRQNARSAKSRDGRGEMVFLVY
jgi:hypothetical protein